MESISCVCSWLPPDSTEGQDNSRIHRELGRRGGCAKNRWTSIANLAAAGGDRLAHPRGAIETNLAGYRTFKRHEKWSALVSWSFLLAAIKRTDNKTTVTLAGVFIEQLLRKTGHSTRINRIGLRNSFGPEDSMNRIRLSAESSMVAALPLICPALMAAFTNSCSVAQTSIYSLVTSYL